MNARFSAGGLAITGVPRSSQEMDRRPARVRLEPHRDRRGGRSGVGCRDDRRRMGRNRCQRGARFSWDLTETFESVVVRGSSVQHSRLCWRAGFQLSEIRRELIANLADEFLAMRDVGCTESCHL